MQVLVNKVFAITSSLIHFKKNEGNYGDGLRNVDMADRPRRLYCIAEKQCNGETNTIRNYAILGRHCSKIFHVNTLHEHKLRSMSRTSEQSFVLLCLSVSNDYILMRIYSYEL